jgi:hypothetical protein
MSDAPNVQAVWSLSLSVACPACKYDFDVLETHDIVAEGIQTCEHDTEASRNVELGCPECGHEFLADLAY